MSDAVVLVASGSLMERQIAGSSLGEAGCATRDVASAEVAAKEVAARGRSCVLMIDSGLLEASHDPQWRLFRAQHPELGVIVRCLIPGIPGHLRDDARTFLVSPRDFDGVRQAVHALTTAPQAAGDRSEPS